MYVRTKLRILVFLTMMLSACSYSKYITNDSKASIIPMKPVISWHRPVVGSLVEAQKTQKLVMIYIHMPNCVSCVMMERKTLSNPEVISKLNNRFVSIWMNANDIDDAEFFDYNFFPAIVFLSSQGIKITDVKGWVSPESFSRLLDDTWKYAVEKKIIDVR